MRPLAIGNGLNGLHGDYVTMSYPEGNISEEYNVFFNRNMVKKVLYKGYETEEEQKLCQELE